MGLSIRSPRSRTLRTKPTFLPPIDAARNPRPPLDLRSEPVFLNGPPPGEDEPGQENRASHAAQKSVVEESPFVLDAPEKVGKQNSQPVNCPRPHALAGPESLTRASGSGPG